VPSRYRLEVDVVGILRMEGLAGITSQAKREISELLAQLRAEPARAPEITQRVGEIRTAAAGKLEEAYAAGRLPTVPGRTPEQTLAASLTRVRQQFTLGLQRDIAHMARELGFVGRGRPLGGPAAGAAGIPEENIAIRERTEALLQEAAILEKGVTEERDYLVALQLLTEARLRIRAELDTELFLSDAYIRSLAELTAVQLRIKNAAEEELQRRYGFSRAEDLAQRQRLQSQQRLQTGLVQARYPEQAVTEGGLLVVGKQAEVERAKAAAALGLADAENELAIQRTKNKVDAAEAGLADDRLAVETDRLRIVRIQERIRAAELAGRTGEAARLGGILRVAQIELANATKRAARAQAGYAAALQERGYEAARVRYETGVGAERFRRELAGQQGAQATRFQRVLAFAGQRGYGGGLGGAAADQPTLGRFLGQRFLTTAGYGLAAISFRGILQGIGELVSEAEKLEKIFNQIRAQFVSTGREELFPGFRERMLDIARETGQAGDEVAFVGFQMAGAFYDVTDALGSTQRAANETQAAMRIVAITGLEMGEVIDSLTGITLTFGTSIEYIGDRAVGLQERFGVLAKETIEGVADLAPVAAEVGLTFEQTSALIAAAQQLSARSGASLAEAFGRILPAMHEARLEILALYSETPRLAAGLEEITAAVGRGDMGDVLNRLIRDFNGLSEAEQGQIITMLGGRREAQALIPVLRNSAKYIEELDRAQSDAGKSAQYFADLQETVGHRLAQLRERFKQLGDELFKAGLADFIKLFVSAGDIMLTVLTALVNVFEKLNEVTGGWAGQLLGLVVTMRIVTALMKTMRDTKLGEFFRNLGINTSFAGVRMQAAGLVGQRPVYGPPVPPGLGGLGGAPVYGPPAPPGVMPPWWRRAGEGLRGRAGPIAAGGLVAGAAGVAGGLDAAVGAGLTLGVLGATPLGFGVAALQIKSAMDAANNQFVASLKQMREEDIQAVVDGEKSLGDKVKGALLGATAPDKKALSEAEQRRRSPENEQLLRELEALQKAGIDKIKARGTYEGSSKEAGGKRYPLPIEDVITRVREGTLTTVEETMADIIKIRDALSPEDRRKFDEALAAATRKAAEEAGKPTEQELRQGSIDEIKSLYEAGLANVQQLLSAYQRQIDLLRTLPQPLSREDAEQLAKFLNERNGVFSGLVTQEVEATIALGEATGTLQPPAKVTLLLGALKRATTPEARAQIAKQLVQAQKELLDYNAEQTRSAEERARIYAQGVKIDPAAREALLYERITQLSPEYIAFIESIFSTLPQQAGMEAFQEAARTIAELVIEGGKSLREAARVVLDRQLFALQDLIRSFRSAREPVPPEMMAQLEAVKAAYGAIETLPTIDIPGVIKPTAEEKKKADEERAKQMGQLFDAEDDLFKALHSEDALRLADKAIEQAKRHMREAEALEDLDERALAVAQAKVELAEAERDKADLLREITAGTNELLIAYAEAAGDVVLAAQLAAAEARRVFTEAKARGVTGPDLQALEQEAFTKAEALKASRVQETQELIDFQLEMGEITTGQAVAALEALLASPDVQSNKQRVREIRRAIKSLKDQTSADLQFNLGDLRIPTLYEVRRTNQAAVMGIGYNDNRQVTVTFNNYNATDYEGAVDRFIDIVQQPSRVGTIPRLAPSRN
jgi:hypothetical protein